MKNLNLNNTNGNELTSCSERFKSFSYNYAFKMMYTDEAIIDSYDASRLTFEDFKNYYTSVVYIYELINNEEVLIISTDTYNEDLNEKLKSLENTRGIDLNNIVIYEIDGDDILEHDFDDYVKNDVDYIIKAITLIYDDIDKTLQASIFYYNNIDKIEVDKLRTSFTINYIDEAFKLEEFGGSAGSSEALDYEVIQLIKKTYGSIKELLEESETLKTLKIITLTA